jgi:prepilin-type N-terminal cleavage/methylation domain-containing protein
MFVRRRGFTVIEIIIVMAIFSIVLGVVIQIFVFTTRTQRRSRNVQEAYAQGRAAVEALAREGQNGSIDYDFYADPASGDSLADQPVGVTALRDSQGQLVRFRCVERLAESIEPCNAANPAFGQVQMCRGGGCEAAQPSWAGITDEATDVISWRVWLGPVQDPFRRDPANPARYLADAQPWVTVAATVQPPRLSGTQLPEVRVQSTVTSRVYLR